MTWEFVKPNSKWIKASKDPTNEDIVPSMRITSTQDVLKIEADKLYSVIHKLVPQACLFIILPIPEHHEEEADCSLLLVHEPSLTEPLPSIDSPSNNTLSSIKSPSSIVASLSLFDLSSINPPSPSNPPSSDPLPSLDLPSINPSSIALVPHQGVVQEKLPKPLADFFTENCKGNDQEKGKQLFYLMHLQEKECMAVEKATRTQRESDIWYQQ